MPIHSHLPCQFSVTSPSSFFPTTVLWVHFVKLPTEHFSNISLAMIETTWMCESSILLLLETKFLTSKLCNTLWTKINAWAYVAYFCNYLFYFYLFNFFFFLILTLEIFNLHAVYVGFHVSPKTTFLTFQIIRLHIYNMCVCQRYMYLSHTHTLTKEYSSEIYPYRKIYVFFDDHSGHIH